jgi:hypothetical protein
MRKTFRPVILVLCLALLLVMAVAVPVAAAPGGVKGPPEKTTIVAPTVGGPVDGVVKAPVAMVPDKSALPPFGGEYPGEGEPSLPGTVFWDDGDGLEV